MAMNFSMRNSSMASGALVIGGAMWGLFWIPLRAIGNTGLKGAWPGMLVFSVIAVVLLVALIARGSRFDARWWTLAWCGLCTGAAFSLYAVSLFMTDVVRVILLFYMTPVWSTLLGLCFLGERLTLSRVMALALGFCGLLIILGAGVQFPWPRNTGDVLAFLAGVAWAYGTFCLYRSGQTDIVEQVAVFSFGVVFVSMIAIAFGGAFAEAPSPWPPLTRLLPILLFTAAFGLPMIVLTIWPATVLSPARVGLLLMSEVVVGVISAALVSGEPFGLRELLGAICIACAGLLEVMGKKAPHTV